MGVKKSGGLLVWICIDVIVVSVKIRIEPYSPTEIDSADTKLQRFLNLRYWSMGGET